MKVETLAERVFFTTVRIDTKDDNGRSGSGTGFMYSFETNGETYPFIVTNKHVVFDPNSDYVPTAGFLTFLLGENDQPRLGESVRVEVNGWGTAWFGHPDPNVDICVYPLLPIIEHVQREHGVPVFTMSISSSSDRIAEHQLAEVDAIETVTFVGYPNGIWDSSNLLPVARQGITASPMAVDFEGAPKFLIDASVFGGSSGSPVFLFNQGLYPTRTRGTLIGSRLVFVGVVAAVFFRTSFSEVVEAPIPTAMGPIAHGREMLDLGIVFKARTVDETIAGFLASRGIAVGPIAA